MEAIKQGTSTDGIKYRMLCWTACNERFYEIEYLEIFYYDDGTRCECWYPAYEPQKIFTDMEKALKAWSYFLIPY